MLRDITLGQFFPGESVVHRLDPRTKLALTVVYIAALYSAKAWCSFALMLCVLAAIAAVSRIKPKALLRGLRPVVFLILFTAVLNMLFSSGGKIIVEFWILKITDNGLILAGKMALRVMMLISGTFLLTYTTSPLALTDAIERILSPLKKIRFPAHELAMMMSIALRFIPILIEETDKIMSAQKARGASFDIGGPIKRMKALLPVLIPLFVSAFRRADELAEAMEARCYSGGKGRTRMNTTRFSEIDAAAVLAGAAVVAAIQIFNRFLV